MPQVPPLQVAPPLAGTRHGLHEPQCIGSLAASTHRWPHKSGVGGAQPLHATPPGTALQAGVVPPQTVPQAPQLSKVVSDVSQPGAAVQSPKPATQAPARTQTLPAQATRAASTLGSAVQS
jgi:hypothetical protein